MFFKMYCEGFLNVWHIIYLKRALMLTLRLHVAQMPPTKFGLNSTSALVGSAG